MSITLPFFHVDAFSRTQFGGNPAAVCVLDDVGWLEDEQLQAIAAEHNLSETAFLVRQDEDGNEDIAGPLYDIRWLTPRVEVDLCGHATLASAYVVLDHVDRECSSVRFQSPSGTLVVRRHGDRLLMDFPSRAAEPCPVPDGLASALGGVTPVETLRSRDTVAVLDDQEKVRDLDVDLDALTRLTMGNEQTPETLGVIVTAPGLGGVDFVSRFFCPRTGISEDPVTGSAHCTLVPYWSKQLGKTELVAHQVSCRGGELFCEDLGDRVTMAGYAALYAKGEVYIDVPRLRRRKQTLAGPGPHLR